MFKAYFEERRKTHETNKKIARVERAKKEVQIKSDQAHLKRQQYECRHHFGPINISTIRRDTIDMDTIHFVVCENCALRVNV